MFVGEQVVDDVRVHLQRLHVLVVLMCYLLLPGEGERDDDELEEKMMMMGQRWVKNRSQIGEKWVKMGHKWVTKGSKRGVKDGLQSQ